MKPRTNKARTTTRRFRWASLSDEELLDIPLCDLGLTRLQPKFEACLGQVQQELKTRGLNIEIPHWLSDEWFVPLRVPGVALPFYLGHKRLERLERNQMLEVEGGTRVTFMRILRHELGHVVDHAFRLNRRRRRQQLFGKSSKPYPETYSPKPYSRSFVLHLDSWYAQSHPDEDFAETFAVWLTPNFPWERRYQNWGALEKLRYVDELMGELRDRPPLVPFEAPVDPLSTIEKTLREHYQEKRDRYAVDHPRFYDRDLRRLFKGCRDNRDLMPATTFIRRNRRKVGEKVGRWTGVYRYTIKLAIDDMSKRCQELGLRLGTSEEQALSDFTVLLTVQTMNFVQKGRHHFSL